jgi:hypothetical protein
VNLKTMLARFESALGCHNLAEEMVLVLEPKIPISPKDTIEKCGGIRVSRFTVFGL